MFEMTASTFISIFRAVPHTIIRDFSGGLFIIHTTKCFDASVDACIRLENDICSI